MPFLNNPDVLRLLGKFGLQRSSDGQLLLPPFNPIAKTANYTIRGQADPNGTLFTNRGAAGAVTFTLPGPTEVPAGQFYLFGGRADQNITVAAPSAATAVAFNNAAATSLSASTVGQKIGALIYAFCDGTQWYLIGIGVGVTYTVA